jgi:CzcA family heavy metal efflux pump
MNSIIAWSVSNRGLVAALSIVWLAIGTWIAWHAPLDVFPEFVPPTVSIQTEAPGLSPEQVEQLVTRPVEAAVNGAPGLDTLRSESKYGLSAVTITFKESADPYTARQGISERIAALSGTLPQGIAQPKLSPLTSSTMDVLKIGLVSDTVDPFELREVGEWTLKPRLLAVPGIARVNVFGGAIRQIQIQPKLDRMTALGLTMTDIATAGRQALALRGAGFIDTGPQRITIETPIPEASPSVLAEAVVTVQNNQPIRLGDIATVTIAPGLQFGDALVQGRPGVLLTISGQFGENTLAATEATEKVLEELLPALEAKGIKAYPAIHRPATFVQRSLSNLERALMFGVGLILMVLYAFLRSVRTALISFAAIPLSLLAAVAALSWLGQSLNTITLGGFAVALGVLVDDAIIDIENIMRRLREGAAAGNTDRLAIIRDASNEVRGSMFYGTAAVIFVFLPVLLYGGVQGHLIGPIASAFILAVIASLVVAMTVTPALAAILMADGQHLSESGLIRGLKRLHAFILWVVQKTWIAATLLLLGAAVAAAMVIPNLYSEFIPAFREGHFVVQVRAAATGTSLDEMTALGQRISRKLLALPYIATVAAQFGRAELGEDTWNQDRAEFHIELKSTHGVREDSAQEQIRAVMKTFPEVRSETLTFLGDRISESISGETAQVVVNVFGNDLDAIEHAASDISGALRDIKGMADLRTSQTSSSPAYAVRFDAAKLARFGLNKQDAADTLQTAFAGQTLGQAYQGARTVDVVAILPPEARNRLDSIGRLTIGNGKTQVPLSSVADIGPREGRSAVLRETGQRRVGVTFNAQGRSVKEVVADARAKIAGMSLPKDVYVTFAGQAEAERESQIRLGGLGALSFLLVVLVTMLAFKRRRLAILVLVNLPFCLIGSIATILVAGTGLTLGSLVGLVTVFGVGARNSIMMLAHVEHLVDVEGQPWTRETIWRAASERLVPILMTALMAALGLVPLALGLGRAGYEIEAPMAITVLGGLTTATILNLIMLPELLTRAGRWLGHANSATA